jgi:hypothetical protein
MLTEMTGTSGAGLLIAERLGGWDAGKLEGSKAKKLISRLFREH